MRPPRLMRETLSLMRETLSLMRETLSLMRETLSLMRETPSLMHEAPSLMHEAPSLMNETPSLMHEAPSLMTPDQPEEMEAGVTTFRLSDFQALNRNRCVKIDQWCFGLELSVSHSISGAGVWAESEKRVADLL